MKRTAATTGRAACGIAAAVFVLFAIPMRAAEPPGTVTVTFYRPAANGLNHSVFFSCDHSNFKIVVFRNGEKMLRIEKGNFVTLHLPEGHYAFKSTRSKTLEIDLKASIQYYFRPRQSCAGVLHAQEVIELVPCEEAAVEAKPLAPLGAEDIFIEKSLIDKAPHYSGVCREHPAF